MSNDQLPAHFKQSDFENLEEFLKEERQLNFLRKNLLDKIQKCSEKIDKEWEQMDTKVRCVLIGDMQKYLFQLQLMEHVSRKPLLDIAIGLFLHNPERCVQRKLSPVKSKPPKRRKNNEFCGFTSNNSIEEIGVKRVPSSNQDKLDFDDQGSFGDHLGPNIEARLRRHVRTIKNTPHHSPSRVGDKEEDEDDIGDEEDSASLNLILKSPSPTLEEDCSMVLSRRRMDSVNTEQIGNSSPATATRNIQKFGRKEGEIVSVEVANGLAGVRSPRKRGIEAQRNNNESNVTTDAKDDDFQKEKDDDFHKQTFDEPTYCLCEQVSFGDMICCDFELCSVEWFHFSCVNIKSKPKGKKWYCPLCRYNDKTNLLKPELQQKLDQTKKSAQGQ